MPAHTVLIKNMHRRDLNVLTFGYEKCEKGHFNRYAYENFYLIHYVKSGKGEFIKDDQRFSVRQGQIFIIKPGHVYEYVADENEPWEYIWISFNGEEAKNAEKINDVAEARENLFEEMKYAENLKNTKELFLTGKLYELMSELFEPVEEKSEYVKTVSDYIKVNCMKRLYVSEIAKDVGLNSRYLSHLFKKETGLTLQEYILKYKIKKAKSLLEHDFNVGETAKAVGYDDLFTFSKAFKRISGCSPALYIENVRKSKIKSEQKP